MEGHFTDKISYKQLTISGQSGFSPVINRIGYYNGTSWAYAIADDEIKSTGLLGVCPDSVGSVLAVKDFIVDGLIGGFSGLVAGDKYYLLNSGSGEITNDVSAYLSTDIIRYIGTAKSTTELYFQQGYVDKQVINTKYIQVAISDLTSDLTTGTNLGMWSIPYDCTLVDVHVELLDAGTVSGITVDINENGTSVLSTKLTTDATEKGSNTATTPAVISDSTLTRYGQITFDIDATGTALKGAIVTLTVEI